MPSLAVKIRGELNQLGTNPKKSLGQNFLINEGVYRKIIIALEIKPDDTILEIGPGLGTLTEYLAQSGAKILAIEKDHKLAEYLKQKFQNNPKIEIIEGDVLKFNPIRYTLNAKHFKIVGNIPYYVTSRLLRIIFENWPAPQSVVLTIQKEVAQRATAKPPKMSLLAVSVQYYAEPKVISYVSKSSFWPSPKVDSAIIKFSPKAGTYHLAPSTFFQIVRAGFAGKRKQLVNNLVGGLGMPKQIIEEKMQSAGIDPKRRAETLSTEEWQTLAKTV